MPEVRLVSHSEFKLFRRCKRSWWLAFQRRLVPIAPSSGALTLGILTHLGMQILYDGGSLNDARSSIRDHVLAQLDLFEDDSSASEYLSMGSDAQSYCEGYVNWLHESGADQRYEHVAAEREFSMPLVEIDGVQWILGGKLDRVVMDRQTGLHRFIDFKTTQSFNAIIENALRNEQFPTYEMLLRHNTDERVGGGIWRMILKRKRARDGDGKFFEDYECSFNDEVLESVRARYVAMAHEMHLIEVLLRRGNDHRTVAYPSPTFTCSWDCTFKIVCDMFDDGSRVEGALESMFISGDPYARYTELKEGL